MFPSACSLAAQNRQTTKKKQAGKHKGKETTKITKKNTNGNVQSVTTCKERQKTSEADPFRNMKVKISYTLEDGHVGRNM
jgi:hypothetical protein